MRFRRGRHFFIEMVTKCFFDTHQASILAPFWSHFGGLGLVFGVRERPWGDFGGFENEVTKRDVPGGAAGLPGVRARAT